MAISSIKTIRLLTVAVVVFMMAVTATSIMAAPAHAVSVDAEERSAVAQINDYRRAHGLVALKVDKRLTRAADWMSTDMGARNYFSHTDSLGRSPFGRISAQRYPRNTWRGENLAAGNADAASTVTQWKTSPAHNANLLNPRYRAIGISRVYTAGSTYGNYWTTTYGSRVTKRI